MAGLAARLGWHPTANHEKAKHMDGDGGDGLDQASEAASNIFPTQHMAGFIRSMLDVRERGWRRQREEREIPASEPGGSVSGLDMDVPLRFLFHSHTKRSLQSLSRKGDYPRVV